MNKKDIMTIKEEYQSNYNYYKLTKYNQQGEEYIRVKAIKGFLQNIGINTEPFENEIILEKETLINDWQEFCEFANFKEKTCNRDNIENIKEEMAYTSESEKQYKARIERINNFIDRLYKFNIKLPA